MEGIDSGANLALRVIPDSLIYHGWTSFDRLPHLDPLGSQFSRFAMCRDLPILLTFTEVSFFHVDQHT